jgi:hypothetical protein
MHEGTPSANARIMNNHQLTSIDTADLQAVTGGDGAGEIWNGLKKDVSDTFHRYKDAANGYASSAQNLRNGNYQQSAKDGLNAYKNQVAGNVDGVLTIEDSLKHVPVIGAFLY